MQKIIIAIATKIAVSFLKEFSQSIWDAFWDLVLKAIRDAENRWVTGEVRKEWVLSEAMKYMDSRRKMNSIQRWAIRNMLERVIAAIVSKLNSNVGHDWGAEILDLKAFLAGKIPFIG